MSKKLVIVGVGLFALASVAFAGLPEREKQRALEPVIATASAAVTESCGCSPAVNVDWASFKTAQSMYTIDFLFGSYKEIAEEICKADREAKEGFCSNVKNVSVKWTPESPTASCAGGTCEFAVGSESYLTAPFKEFLEKL